MICIIIMLKNICNKINYILTKYFLTYSLSTKLYYYCVYTKYNVFKTLIYQTNKIVINLIKIVFDMISQITKIQVYSNS